MYAMHWENLKKDNSPLRAVVNGRVIGVPEIRNSSALLNRLHAKSI